MQQGVQMDTTDNIQQCYVRLRGLTLYYVVNSKTRRDESKQVSFHQFQRAVLLDVKYNYEIIHFWTAVVDESEEWSSQ